MEACKWQNHAEYLRDQLILRNAYERSEVVSDMLRDNRLHRLSAHLKEARKEVGSHGR